MFELWAVWPPDDPFSTATAERLRLDRVLPEQLGAATARRLHEVEVLNAGLEIVRRGGVES